jgi:predicted small secreted protein
MKKLVLVLVGCGFALNLLGCNTVAGVGKDVQKVGETVQDAAKK